MNDNHWLYWIVLGGMAFAGALLFAKAIKMLIWVIVWAPEWP